MQNQEFRLIYPRKARQAGNALWFILVAIGLLAALTLTLTRNSSKMATNLGDEKTRVLAEQSLRTFNGNRQGIEKLLAAGGCSESDLSFEHTLTGGSAYANSGSPTDKHCWLFDGAGAGLSAEGLTMPAGTKLGTGNWIITGTSAVSGVGPESATEATCSSKCAELLIVGSGVSPEFCTQYNQLATTLSALPVDSTPITPTEFTGTYDEGTTSSHLIAAGSGNSTTALYNIKTACVASGNINATYLVYYVLLQR